MKNVIGAFAAFFILSLPLAAEKLTVFDCLNEALRNNQDIRNAVLAYRQNDLDQMKILARYIPTVGAGYTAAEINEPSATSAFNTYPVTSTSLTPSIAWAIPGGGVLKADWSIQASTITPLPVPPGSPSDSFTRKLTLSVVQPLLRDFFLVPADINVLRMASSSRRIASMAIEQASQAVAYNTYLSFINLVINDLNVAVKTASLDRSRFLLQKNEQNRALGIVEDTDILGSRAALNLRILDYVASTNQRNDVYNNLRLLMNTAKDFVPDPDVAMICGTAKSDYDPDAEVREALSNRIEVRMLNEQARIQRINVQVLRSKLLPQLSLIGSYSYYGNALAADLADAMYRDDPKHSWTAGLQLSMPLFPLGEIDELKKQLLELEKTANTLEKTREQIRLQIVSKVNEIQTLRIRLDAVADTVGCQREKLLKESEKFKVGRSSTRTVIMYQDDLQNAETLELQLKLQYYVAVASLDFLKGRLLASCGIAPAGPSLKFE
jgi:outer membrane protein TolC